MKDADRRSSKTSFKRLEKMTESQKAAAIREFDREFIADTFSAPGPRQRDLWRRAKSKKPIGLACIAPVLAARVLGSAGLKPKLTVGTDQQTADAIHAMKGEHQNTGETDISIDETNRLVTTPCYMNHVGPWTAYQGAEKMVEQVLRMAGSQ